MKIEKLVPRMILDSRGCPTVEVDCYLDDGSFGRASVPSGASTGVHEALELRDGGALFAGKGVEGACKKILEIISPKVIAIIDPTQQDIDELLIEIDGTSNKSFLGANATLAVSLAFARAVAAHKKVPLYRYLRETYQWVKEMSMPMPLINVLNGGRHAKNSTDIQEWMIIPIGAKTFKDAIELSARVYYSLKDLMIERGSSAVGDEGGFPLLNCSSNEDALILLTEAVTRLELVPGKDIAYALDVASSEFFKDGKYQLSCERSSFFHDEMIDWLDALRKKYPIVSIEDGLAEDMWEAWAVLTRRLGNAIQIVGDDLFVTNTTYIQKGIHEHAANAVLIKPNQIGTLTETVNAIVLAQRNNMNAIVSHRSGETEDAFIAHLSVASGCGQIKTGSLSRSERLSKYNELLRISEDITHFSQLF